MTLSQSARSASETRIAAESNRGSTKSRTSSRTSLNKASGQRQSQRYRPEAYTFELVGGMGAGKTTLVRRLTKRVFEASYQPTTEELHTATFPVDDLAVTLHIQDRGHAQISVARLARSPAHGLLLVFSVTDQASFAYLQRFVEVASGRLSVPATILVGTHADCDDGERQVGGDEAAALAAQLGVPYVETSALSHRCTVPFYMLVRTLRADASPEADRLKLKAAQESAILTGTVLHIRPPSSPGSGEVAGGGRGGGGNRLSSMLSLQRWLPWAKAK